MADFLDTLTDAASDAVGNFDLDSFIKTAAQAYATVRKAQQPGAVTLPATLPAVGTVRTLPDGSRALVNPDGSLTIQSATGAVRTVGGATWIAGIPNGLVLGAGAVVLALILLRR